MKKTHIAILYRRAFDEEDTYELDNSVIPASDFNLWSKVRLPRGHTKKVKITPLKNGFKAEVVK